MKDKSVLYAQKLNFYHYRFYDGEIDHLTKLSLMLI